MSVKPNVLSIKALKPRRREYETAVKEHRGLVVCTYPSNAKSFANGRFFNNGTDSSPYTELTE